MKALFTLLFSVILIYSANAQTKQETLKWLNKNKKHISSVQAKGYVDENTEVELTENYIKVYGKEEEEKYESKIYWSEIAEITLYLSEKDKGFVILSTASGGSYGPFITLHFSKQSAEMKEKLALMVRYYRSVILSTFDMRGKSIFGNE